MTRIGLAVLLLVALAAGLCAAAEVPFPPPTGVPFGDLLTGRLFIWDGMEAHAEEICVERNPACEACRGMTTTKTPARKKK